MTPPKKVRALALLSGGLDSTLAIRTLLEQGIEVTALSFATPFFTTKKAAEAAERLGVPLLTRDISEVHWEVVKRPKHGYGKQINPCIDCHGLMFRFAREIMESEGYDFVSTGEVLGQRPMSQNARALRIVEELAGLPGQILRPLSAQLLPETPAEQTGLVDRTRLHAFSGKNRKPQIALAAEWGVTDYPAPAGGCKLTDPGFAVKLKGLFAHQGTDPELADTRLLPLGRVVYVGQRSLVVLGRDAAENEKLIQAAQKGDLLVRLAELAGPQALVRVHAPDTAESLLAEAKKLVTQYSRAARETAGELAWEVVEG